MKNYFLKTIVPFILIACSGIEGQTNVLAPKNKNMFYLGIGNTNESGIDICTEKPWAVGWYILRNSKSLSYGFDVSGEGTMIDSKGYNYNTTSQGKSVNFIVLKNFQEKEKSKTYFGALVGIRNTVEDCPASYIGYECYANQTPHTESEANIGLVFNYIQDNLSIGARVTTKSTMLTLGVVL